MGRGGGDVVGYVCVVVRCGLGSNGSKIDGGPTLTPYHPSIRFYGVTKEWF